jgi:Ca-activated chloride channel family protein
MKDEGSLFSFQHGGFEMRARPWIFALLFAVLGGAARGQGILFPRPEIREQPFSVKSVRVTANVTENVAETAVEQVFVNNSRFEQEGTYLFPLPEGATVTSFSLKAGDRVLEGRVLRKEEASSIYESIVRRRRDPALLEYMGHGLFRASVFPIPPGGERTLTLKYAQIVRAEGGLKKFVYPLSTGRFSARPLDFSSVTVRLKTAAPLKTVYSPTHDVSVRRIDDYTATASWEGRLEVPDRDFTLYYATQAGDVGLSLLTYQSGDRDGYFMLIAAPRVSVPKEKILPKQVVFVLDRTGSMAANNKIEQARNALNFCLDKLNPNDRFDIITFNESADIMAKGLLAATPENVRRGHRFVQGVEASGGTNIDEALRAALGLLKNAEGSHRMVVFLTDGLPTVGETNVDTILAHVKRINGGGRLASAGQEGMAEAAGVHARIFCFGVGYDVNVPFLDQLAEQTRADADYVRPEESVEGIVSAFYAKVSSPILANLRLAFDGIQTYDVFPKELPDLFKGSQLIVSGRFRGDGSGGVRLVGTAQGQQAAYKLESAFGENAARSSLVPRIWAMRKIGYLLDEVRLHSNQEVVDEIIRLSKEYGIITPYTSYLADERQDGAVRARLLPGGVDSVLAYDVDNALTVRAGEEARRDLNQLSDRYKDVAGESAAFKSLNSKGYQQANRAPTGAQGGFGGGGFGGPGGGRGGGPGMPGLGGMMAGQSRSQLGVDFGKAGDALQPGQMAAGKPVYQNMQEAARVQAVAGRVFYKRNNIWFDNGYKSGQKVLKVQALSEAHFQLLKAVPELNRYAAVGDEVVLNVGRIAVQIGKEGKETLTAVELKEITGK